jgi:hypothetical protein
MAGLPMAPNHRRLHRPGRHEDFEEAPRQPGRGRGARYADAPSLTHPTGRWPYLFHQVSQAGEYGRQLVALGLKPCRLLAESSVLAGKGGQALVVGAELLVFRDQRVELLPPSTEGPTSLFEPPRSVPVFCAHATRSPRVP